MQTDDRVHRVHVNTHPLEHARSIVEIVAFIVAAAWGAYVFAYQEVIKPANEPPRLETSVSVDHAAIGRGNELVTVRVTYQNPGKSEIDLAAESLTIWGRGVRDRDANTSTGNKAWDVDRSRSLTERELITDSGLLRDAAVDGTRGQHFVLAPGASGFEDYAFVIKQHRYDLIEIAYDAWFLRSNYGTHRVALVRRKQPDGSSIVTRLLDAGGAEAYSNNGKLISPL